MSTAPTQSWEAAELPFRFIKDEAARLLARARARRFVVLAIAVLASGGFCAKRVLAPKPHEAQITLRIVETSFELTRNVRAPRAYLDYVWGVFLSAPNLTRIITQRKLYPAKFIKDPRLAVEALRDDLDVKIWRNYFLEDHTDDDQEARSVRVGITFLYRDPDIAVQVVKDLGAIIVETQADMRRQVFEVAQREIRDEETEAAERFDAMVRKIADLRRELAHAEPARVSTLNVRLRDLRLEAVELRDRVKAMGSDKTQVDLAAALERRSSGLRVELVDPGVLLPHVGGGPIVLAASTVMVFLVAALVAGLIFGAFEVRIRQPADVRRLGLRLLGAVPSFKGDGVGALSERLRVEDRLKWGPR